MSGMAYGIIASVEEVKSADGKLLLTMDRLDMSSGTIKHQYIPDFLLN